MVKPSNGSYHCLPSRVNEHCARNKEQESLGHSKDDYWGEVDLCGEHQHYQECVLQGNKSLFVLSSTRSEIESGTTRFFYKELSYIQNSFSVYMCTIHSFWNMSIRINQAYAQHKLMKVFTKYIYFLQSELNILCGVQKNQRLHPHFLELRWAPKYFLISTFPPLKPEIYSALPNTTLTYFHGLAFQMSLGFLTCCT